MSRGLAVAFDDQTVGSSSGKISGKILSRLFFEQESLATDRVGFRYECDQGH